MQQQQQQQKPKQSGIPLYLRHDQLRHLCRLYAARRFRFICIITPVNSWLQRRWRPFRSRCSTCVPKINWHPVHLYTAVGELANHRAHRGVTQGAVSSRPPTSSAFSLTLRIIINISKKPLCAKVISLHYKFVGPGRDVHWPRRMLPPGESR